MCPVKELCEYFAKSSLWCHMDGDGSVIFQAVASQIGNKQCRKLFTWKVLGLPEKCMQVQSSE